MSGTPPTTPPPTEGAPAPTPEPTPTPAPTEGAPATPTPTPEPAPTPEPPKQPDWVIRRLADMAAQKNAAEEKARKAEQELAALRAANGGTPPTPAPAAPAAALAGIQPGFVPQAEVEQRAAELARINEFNRKCDDIHRKGVGAYPDFMASIGNFNMLGGLQAPLIEAAIETEDPAKVLYMLGKDLNEAQRIMGLPAASQGVALARFAAKHLSKPVSSAPPPVAPVVGAQNVASGEVDLYNENVPIDVWMAKRKAQVAELRKKGVSIQ